MFGLMICWDVGRILDSNMVAWRTFASDRLG